jgi:hypothetical protein
VSKKYCVAEIAGRKLVTGSGLCGGEWKVVCMWACAYKISHKRKRARMDSVFVFFPIPVGVCGSDRPPGIIWAQRSCDRKNECQRNLNLAKNEVGLHWYPILRKWDKMVSEFA